MTKAEVKILSDLILDYNNRINEINDHLTNDRIGTLTVFNEGYLKGEKQALTRVISNLEIGLLKIRI